MPIFRFEILHTFAGNNDDGGSPIGNLVADKQFFFEKKNQKTFLPYVVLTADSFPSVSKRLKRHWNKTFGQFFQAGRPAFVR